MGVAEMSLGGRDYARVYRVSRKKEVLQFICAAVEASGATLLYVSTHARAPVFIGIQTAEGERLGALCYPFTANHRVIRNRPRDEHRLQIKYGDVSKAREQDNALGFDVAGVDTTVVMGVNHEDGYFIGLDPLRYDPLPMGIMVGWKQDDVDEVLSKGWHVWERDNHSGTRRTRIEGPAFETLVGFIPDRLVDFLRFERQSSGLGLDSALRQRAAETAGVDPVGFGVAPLHDLEQQFEIDAQEILNIISSNHRLGVAVRGGVAEHHLEALLRADPSVEAVNPIDEDGQPDFDVALDEFGDVLVECKNASPKQYQNGDFKVEVQKTRSQKGDPAGRFYRLEQFDVVAACVWAATGSWDFRFRRTDLLSRHHKFPDRIAAVHRVDGSWAATLLGALEQTE